MVAWTLHSDQKHFGKLYKHTWQLQRCHSACKQSICHLHVGGILHSTATNSAMGPSTTTSAAAAATATASLTALMSSDHQWLPTMARTGPASNHHHQRQGDSQLLLSGLHCFAHLPVSTLATAAVAAGDMYSAAAADIQAAISQQ